jgi:hypothetical protein
MSEAPLQPRQFEVQFTEPVYANRPQPSATQPMRDQRTSQPPRDLRSSKQPPYDLRTPHGRDMMRAYKRKQRKSRLEGQA